MRKTRRTVGIAASLGLACWLAAGHHRSSADGKEKQVPAVPPEMKVLEKRLGTWTTVTRGKPAEWTPDGFDNKGEEKIELVMHGRYIQGKVRTQPGNVEALWLATYDVNKKAYRIWYFNSQGDTIESIGKWDADSGTMTWTDNPQPGVTSVARWRFQGADSFEWNVLAKDAAGKVYLDMTGKLTRKK